MALIRAERASFSFADNAPLLIAASFQLSNGFTGLVGENGAGKTSLLRLIAGELKPEAGGIQLEPADAIVALCTQSVEQCPLDLGDSNRAFKLNPTLLGRLSLERTDLLRWPTLSPGERRRWQVALALSMEPDVLLLDEPTNHLDSDVRDWLLRALLGFSGIGILVSHDRAMLDALTTRTLRLCRGEVELWPAPYTQARRLWEEAQRSSIQEREQLRKQLSHQKSELDARRRALEATSRNRNAARRMRNSGDSDARSLGANFRAERAQKHLGRRVFTLQQTADRTQTELATLHLEKTLGREFFVGFEQSPRPWLLRFSTRELRVADRVLSGPLQVNLSREERLGISGPNGSGKTTLLRTLFEALTLSPSRVLYLPQDLSAEQEIHALEAIRGLSRDERGHTLNMLAALGIDPDRALASRRPSAGEARKLLLARALGQNAWLLLLDEPTNHLDLPSVERLHRALQAYPGALVLITHDAGFAEGLVSNVLHLSGCQLR